MILFILTVGNMDARSGAKYDSLPVASLTPDGKFRKAALQEQECRDERVNLVFPFCLEESLMAYAELAADGAPVFTGRFVPAFEASLVYNYNPDAALTAALAGWHRGDVRFRPYVERAYDGVVTDLREDIPVGTRYATMGAKLCAMIAPYMVSYPLVSVASVAEELGAKDASDWYAVAGDQQRYCKGGIIEWAYDDYRHADLTVDAMATAREIGDLRMATFSGTDYHSVEMPWREQRERPREYWQPADGYDGTTRTDHSWEVAAAYWAMGGMTQEEIVAKLRLFAMSAEVDRAYDVAMGMYVFIGDYENAYRVSRIPK